MSVREKKYYDDLAAKLHATPIYVHGQHLDDVDYMVQMSRVETVAAVCKEYRTNVAVIKDVIDFQRMAFLKRNGITKEWKGDVGKSGFTEKEKEIFQDWNSNHNKVFALLRWASKDTEMCDKVRKAMLGKGRFADKYGSCRAAAVAKGIVKPRAPRSEQPSEPEKKLSIAKQVREILNEGNPKPSDFRETLQVILNAAKGFGWKDKEGKELKEVLAYFEPKFNAYCDGTLGKSIAKAKPTGHTGHLDVVRPTKAA